jgi:hypothetical protein
MENKPLPKRKCKQCGEVFQKKSPLQYLCSLKCQAEYKAAKAEGKPKKKNIAPVSAKRLEELAEYRKKKAIFMKKEENKYCPVMKFLTQTDVPATEIHHMNSREGLRLNDEIFWLAVSRKGHQWIHNFPREARAIGWLI